MSDDNDTTGNTPDNAREAAIRNLIRQTVTSMGETSPEALPHMVRERLKGQIEGGADIDRLLRDVLRERGEKPPRG